MIVTEAGRPRVIEYSDLPAALAEAREPDGRLRFAAGSIAIHLFERSFIERLVAGGGQLPFHRAVKKVPHVDESGQGITPGEPNAVKFEQFIFDALPMADRWTVVETSRETEFEPLKNPTGADSPETVQRAISNLAASWLERAGVAVPRCPQGHAAVPLEISPLFALDAEELARKVHKELKVEGPLHLG